MKALVQVNVYLHAIDRDPTAKAANHSKENDVTNPFAMSDKELKKLNLENSARAGGVEFKIYGLIIHHVHKSPAKLLFQLAK